MNEDMIVCDGRKRYRRGRCEGAGPTPCKAEQHGIVESVWCVPSAVMEVVLLRGSWWLKNTSCFVMAGNDIGEEGAKALAPHLMNMNNLATLSLASTRDCGVVSGK